MIDRQIGKREAGLMGRFALAAMAGFAVDAAVLRLGLFLGLEPAVARAVSILTAMQVTFAINGFMVFKCVTRRSLPGHWAAYMVSSGLGNGCSYLIFVTLVSLHREPFSRPWFAFPVSTAVAFAINFVGARMVVFAKALRGDVAERSGIA